MKQKLKIILLAILTAALFCVPAIAADDTPQIEEAEPGSVFQEGGFEGPQTAPGAVDLMSDTQAQLYKLIEDSLESNAESIDVSSFQLSSEKGSAERQLLRTIYTQVINDHPELFYYHSTYGFNSSNKVITKVNPVIIEEITDLDQAKSKFETAVQRALAQVNDQMTDVEKLLVLHDYLVLNCKYNFGVHSGQGAPTQLVYRSYGALVNGDAVCNGYALAYKVLLNRLGIPNMSEGSSAMNHAWNLLQLHGEWYHMDVTWDDLRAEGGCRHGNFLLSDAKFQETGHHDWGFLYTCDSTKYETGWIFNNSRSTVYRYNNQYYCVHPGGVYTSDDLHSEGTNVVRMNQNVHININHGIAWHEDFMYYVFWDSANRLHTLAAIQLDSGKHVQIGQFERTEDHGIGLRYEDGYIIPSNIDTVADRVDLARFPALPRQTAAEPVIEKVDDKFPLYYHNNRFYTVKTERSEEGYLTKVTVSANSGLGSGGTNPDTLNRNIQMHPDHDIVWHGGYLYYAAWGDGSGTETLMAFHLGTGKIIQIGQFDRQGDGGFQVRYDENQRRITAYRNNTILASFAALPEEGVTGITVFDGGTAALAGADSTANQTIWIANYHNGQMTEVRQETLVKPQAYWLFGPLQLDAVVVPLKQNAEPVRVFLLDSHYAPVCPAA